MSEGVSVMHRHTWGGFCCAPASNHSLRVPLPLLSGKWFVSTGKDNLLNAWRTPYGASIFQVHPFLSSSPDSSESVGGHRDGGGQQEAGQDDSGARSRPGSSLPSPQGKSIYEGTQSVTWHPESKIK